MNSDLLRQRRNLILVSLWLLIFDFAKVSIGNVNVLGTELLVGRPQVLIFLAWLLWAYFFLRYYQYWRAENKPVLRKEFRSRLDAYASRFATPPVYQDSAGQLHGHELVKRGSLSWFYTLRHYDPASGYPKEHSAVPLPNTRMIWWSIKSGILTCVNTTHATDHLLPFALAIAAPIVALATWIAHHVHAQAV